MGILLRIDGEYRFGYSAIRDAKAILRLHMNISIELQGSKNENITLFLENIPRGSSKTVIVT